MYFIFQSKPSFRRHFLNGIQACFASLGVLYKYITTNQGLDIDPLLLCHETTEPGSHRADFEPVDF